MRNILLASRMVALLFTLPYLCLLRPWQLRWRASTAKTKRAIPGDEWILAKQHWFSFVIFFNLLVEFFDLLMMQKCMLGRERHAEQTL